MASTSEPGSDRGLDVGSVADTHLIAAVARVLALVDARPATLGDGRLLCVDGPSGAGKSTLADAVAARSGATVLRLDDLYQGWDGLPRLQDQLDGVLLPLAQGRPGHYRRFDWHAGRPAEEVVVEPSTLLVVEGVGAGLRAYDGLRTALVWLDAPVALRRARALARDGDAYAPHWERWAAAEQTLFEREQPWRRADVVLDATGADRREPATYE